MNSIETKAVEQFIQAPVNQDLAHQVVVKTLQIIPCDNSDPKLIMESKKLPSLLKFLNRLITCLNLNNGILMFTIVYLNRLKSKLPNNCKGLPSTRHRILLSCLILSIKFNNDFSLKNHDWYRLTNSLFNLKDINLMERQLLYLLSWNLFIPDLELYNTFNKFLYPIKEKLVNHYRMKQYLAYQQKVQEASTTTSRQPSPKTPKSTFTPSRSSSPYGSYSGSTVTTDPSPKSLQVPKYQPINCLSVPERKTSNSSISSMSSEGSQEDFNSPLQSPVHYRQSSQSSIESLEIPTKVNPIIELTALNEQYELNRLLERFKHTRV